MIDQLIIGDKASFDDYGASLKSRKISTPKKKSIKETVPFSNVTYDFTKINGEIYWEERELEYTLEIIADTPEKLEEMKAALDYWLLNIIQEDLHDPYIPDYHFVATYDDMSYSDEEGLDKTTATVKFTAYPYKVSNYPVEVATTAYYYTETTPTLWILNKSSHKIRPIITTDKDLSIRLNSGTSYSVPAGKSEAPFELDTGHNRIDMYAWGGEGTIATVTIRFYEEVF